MKAVVISVDFADYLAVTLPRNAPHFEEVVVVTTPQDKATAWVVESCPNARLLRTDVFEAKDAAFNKGAGIVEGLRQLGRSGWICLLDADVLLPSAGLKMIWPPNHLYSPLRYMCDAPDLWDGKMDNWEDKYTLHTDIMPGGYCLFFHADDRNLDPWPAFPTHWMNGASHQEFQDKWHPSRKHRIGFDVLHLGRPAQNWYGRTVPPLNWTPPEGHQRRKRHKKGAI